MVGKVLLGLAVLVPLVDVAGFAEAMPLGMVALLVGIAWGVTSPSDDVATRTAFYVLAFALPSIADHLLVIPTAGPILDGFLDSFAVVIAGVAVANVFMQLYAKVMEAFGPSS